MHVHPESQNVNLIVDRVFADVAGLDEFIRSMVALITSMTGILIRRENRHTEERLSHGARSRHWGGCKPRSVKECQQP